MIIVNQGQCKAIAKSKAAVEIKNNNQYKRLDLCFISIKKDFCKNRGECFH